MLFAVLTLHGLAAVVARIAWIGYALRIAGACYLVYLGISLWRSTRAADGPEARAAQQGGDLWHGLRVGFLTGLTNPKAMAFFLSLFAVALPPGLDGTGQAVLLACGFGIELGWYSLVAFALSTRRLREGYARMRKVIDRALGSVLVMLGLRLGAQH